MTALLSTLTAYTIAALLASAIVYGVTRTQRRDETTDCCAKLGYTEGNPES